MLLLKFYKLLLSVSGSTLKTELTMRRRRGKEDPVRLPERMGVPGRPRPDGLLVWIHAASVGEAQSTLTLIDALLARLPQIHVLVTTGTLTSARLMAGRLPPRAFHQFYPLDHPAWVGSFLDHWRPDLALWMESELWPLMLWELRNRQIPAALVNARLSPRSFKIWRLFFPDTARHLLGAFETVLAQTPQDAAAFRMLGARQVVVTDNLKYSATPLPFDPQGLAGLQKALAGRPVWLYASTHVGEEALACRLHAALKNTLPELLTVIVPRHPERRQEIALLCRNANLQTRLRSEGNGLPQSGDDIYIADTLGELGLFYRLAPVACIGRSFSDDGGGGHNPLEAAQLDCAVLHGPHVQNLAAIYKEMDSRGAAFPLRDENEFRTVLEKFLIDSTALEAQQHKGLAFAQEKGQVLEAVLLSLSPLLDKLSMTQKDEAACA